MNNTKILFLDLDGTLLNDQKEITEGNMRAIRKALSQGHRIVISTGRATFSALEQAKKLGLVSEGCYAITFNGACISDLYTGKEIFRKTLPREYVRYLLDAAEAYGLYAHTYTENRILTERKTKELVRYATTTYMKYELVDDVCTALQTESEKVIVINYDDYQKLLDFKASIADWAEGKIECFFSNNFFLEAVAPGVSKGNAIHLLCEALGIPMENTVAAGDAENDISMLQEAHTGVVMKNAEPFMYRYGAYVTERDNNHDGIEEIINKFILNE